jgi:hypothetical protein
MKGVCRFGIKGKLAPHYIGLYPIIDKYEPMSYQVELPARLSVVIEDTIPLELDLTYKAHPIKVHGQQDRVTHNKTTRFYKIQWNDHFEDGATWEHEEFL